MEGVRICKMGATLMSLTKGPENLCGNSSSINMQLLFRQFFVEWKNNNMADRTNITLSFQFDGDK
jgi:hypothetical protein